jgi:magnesium transporter
MRIQTSDVIEVLKQHIDRKDWNQAIQFLATLKAADEAQVFTELSQSEQKQLLPRLTDEHLAKILENLRRDDALRLSRGIDVATLSHSLDRVSPDLAADVLHSLPQASSQRVLEGMLEKEAVSPLLQYADDSAGGLMTTEYVLLTPDMTAAEALSLLRESQLPRAAIDVLYVVNNEKHLLGRLTLRELVLASPESRINDIMEGNVVYVTSDIDREESARVMEHYSLAALPVVDADQHVLGIISLRESIKVAEEEATEDMYHMIGLSGHERIFSPIQDSIKKRLPWLLFNLGTAVLAGFVVSLFDSIIARAVVLAAFIPIIAGQTGNAAIQTGTIMVRSLALGEVTFKNMRRALFKEVGLAAINSLVVALVAGLVALGFLQWNDLWLAPVMAVAMFLSMIVAGLSGALIPLGLKLLGIDPALASTVIITTITDILGFLLLLGAAALAIQYLL